MNAPIIVPIPAVTEHTAVIADQAAMAAITTLTTQAAALVVDNPLAMQDADGLVLRMRAIRDAIEAKRIEIKAAPFALCKQIDSAAGAGRVPLDAAIASLGTRILSFTRVENARREAAAAEARKQADAARAVPPPEDDNPFAEEVDFRAPVHVPEPPPAAPIASLAVRAKSATQAARVEIVDESLVPFTCGGARLWREIDTALCKRLLLGGATIPGLRLVTDDGAALKPA